MRMAMLKTCLFILACLTGTSALPQRDEPMSIWRARPRYHLSLGAEGGIVEVPQQGCSGCDRAWPGARMSVLVRPCGNWLLGAGFSSHTGAVGHLVQYDTTVHVPAHQELTIQNGNLILVWVPEGYRDLYHTIRIDQEVSSIDLSIGWTIPKKWPRRRCHLTATALIGPRMLRVQEVHHYQFSSSSDPMPLDKRTTATGWLWTMHARTDLHLTKYVSLHAGAILSIALNSMDLSSEASYSGETARVNSTREVRRYWLSGGIAIHL